MKLAVAIIHGIGNQLDSRDHEGQHQFAQSLIQGLRLQLGEDSRQVAFQSLYWASVLDKREEAYLAKLANEPVTWRWLRRIVTLFLGDAAGYRKVSEAYDTTYQEVHQCLRNGLNALRAQVDHGHPCWYWHTRWAGISSPTSPGISRSSMPLQAVRMTPSWHWKPSQVS